jgi:hypothetical protein
MRNSGKYIKFSYLYRDLGNYKQFGFEIFLNQKSIPIIKIEKEIRAKLIDNEYFEPNKWNLKTLYNFPFDDELDHFWHEFEKIEFTKEEATSIDIESFLKHIQ